MLFTFFRFFQLFYTFHSHFQSKLNSVVCVYVHIYYGSFICLHFRCVFFLLVVRMVPWLNLLNTFNTKRVFYPSKFIFLILFFTENLCIFSMKLLNHFWTIPNCHNKIFSSNKTMQSKWYFKTKCTFSSEVNEICLLKKYLFQILARII